MKGDLDIIKAALLDRVEELCGVLLRDGRREGPLWVAHNPAGDDRRKMPAFKVRIRNGDLGAWKDWRSGDKGDVLGLVAHCLGTDVKGALAWSRDWLGLQAMTREDREAMRRVERDRRLERDEKAEALRRRRLLDADRLFNAPASEREIGPALVPQGAFKIGAGGAAERHAWAYFAARAVPLDAAPGILAAAKYNLHFSPATEWWKGADWQRDGQRSFKAAPGPLFPTVHAAMRSAMGIVTACHCTFLDPLKPAKAPVSPAKLMYGEAKSAVIEVSTGPSLVPFWMADRDGICDPLVIAEGIETALSFAVNVPQARVWAGGSLAGIASAPVDLACVDWILFARDNNAGNSQAQKQFQAAFDWLESSGKRVVVAASHVGDDFNNLAIGEE